MKLKVNTEEHIITVSYRERGNTNVVKFGHIRFQGNNFQEQKLNFCKENDVYNSELNILDFYNNQDELNEHEKMVADWQSKVECGND